MKGLEFALLNTGWIENDRAWNVAFPNPASISNPKAMPTMWKVPAFCVLIKHPDAGYLLFDAGCHKSDEIDHSAYFKDFFAFHPDTYVDGHLARLGLGVDDISAILLSHLHWDHANGLAYFSGTKAGRNICVTSEDFKEAMVTTHKSCVPNESPYYRKTVEIPGLEYHFIDEDCEYLPGVELVILEGHSPTMLGLVLHLESGTYIFPSDAVYSQENFGPPTVMPGTVRDSLGYLRTVDKLQALKRKYDATMIFAHDPASFATYKQAPEFYK